MKRNVLALVVLAVGAWTAFTIVNAVLRARSAGAVFVTSLCVLALIFLGLMLLAARLLRDRK